MEETLYQKDGITIDVIPTGQGFHCMTRVTWQDEDILGYITAKITKSAAEDIAWLLERAYVCGKQDAFLKVKHQAKQELRRLEDV